MHTFDTPFIIPVVAMLIPIVAIIAGVWSQVESNRMRAEQRLAMLAKGIPLSEIEASLKASTDTERNVTRDPLQSLSRARRAAIVLISTGVGLITFFVVLEVILQVREVLSGAAAGLIPLAIGIGFIIDYQLQKRELARFGVDLDAARS